MMMIRQTDRLLGQLSYTCARGILHACFRFRSGWCTLIVLVLLFSGTARSFTQDTDSQEKTIRLNYLGNSLNACYWSDKLALTPYKEYASIGRNGQWQRLLTHLLNESFGIAGKSAEEASQQITRSVKGGMSVFGHSTVTLLAASFNDIDLAVATTLDLQTDLPEGPFLLLFSGTNGLTCGADLPLTHLGAQVRMYTDIALSYGRQAYIPRLLTTINSLLGNVTDLDVATWDLGLTVTLGNTMLDIATTNGGIHLNTEGTEFFVDADVQMKAAGTTMNNTGAFSSPFEKGLPVVGYGAGVNARVKFTGAQTSLGVALCRLGPMFWSNVQSASLRARTRTMSAENMLENNFDPFDPEHGGMIPNLDSGSVTHNRPLLVEWQPAWFESFASYRFNYSSPKSVILPVITEYIVTGIHYRQNVAPWPGHSFTPELELSVENGFLHGALPVRFGWSVGGSKMVASSLRGSVNLGRCAVCIGYEAIGTPYWYPKKGMGVAIGLCTGF